MLLYILLFIIIVHGLIHLIGFVSGTGIYLVKGFSGNTIINLGNASRWLPYPWLATTILFVASAIRLVTKQQQGEWAIIISVILSQLLIVVCWQDAKAGTIANVIIVSIMLLFA